MRLRSYNNTTRLLLKKKKKKKKKKKRISQKDTHASLIRSDPIISNAKCHAPRLGSTKVRSTLRWCIRVPLLNITHMRKIAYQNFFHVLIFYFFILSLLLLLLFILNSDHINIPRVFHFGEHLKISKKIKQKCTTGLSSVIPNQNLVCNKNLDSCKNPPH